MNWSAVWLLVRHELRMLLRDRRTVLLSVVLPLAVMPAMIFGMKLTGERRAQKHEQTVYRYALAGSYADTLRTIIAWGRERLAAPDTGASSTRFRTEELPAADPDAGLRAGDLHFYIEALSGAEADSAAAVAALQNDSTGVEDKADSVVSVTSTRYPGVPTITIYYRGNRDDSNTGYRGMQRFLTAARKAGREAALRLRGLPLEPAAILPVDSTDVATRAQVTGSFLGRFMTVILVFLMMSGGSVAAMDSIAGEKERGSLETLLTTSVRRFEIIVAKQLAILTVALVIVLIQVANLWGYVSLRLIELPENLAVHLPPAALFLLLVLYIPVASAISSLLLMISAYAKSYKETQWYYMPAFFGLAFLALAAVLPGIPLRSFVAVVPVANVSVAVRDLMVGSYDWLMMGVTCLSMAAAAGLLMRISTRMLSMERLITASEADEADLLGGPALFPKRALIWFMGMWAAMLILSTNVPALMKFEGQYLFNMFVLFLGVPLLIIRIYRLDIRTALALRPVKPVVWPAVLLMIPAQHFAGAGVFFLANRLFPVPEKLLEEFVRFFVPADYPFWQVLLMLSVVPGIVEELSFRGVLLYGLHRRYHPVVVALVVGGMFGLFHTSLFRIIPTAFMGVVLTGLALLTGSAFPCMLLHAGSNAFALAMFHYGVPTDRLSWGYYALGTAAFGLCLYLVYRHRTPYPGLRKSRDA
jgi:sodium transport system permease protein